MALIGLGVSIDYALLVVVRWREEIAHGREGDAAVSGRWRRPARRRVQRHHGRDRPARARRAAAAVPALRSVRRDVIPLVSVVSAHAAAGRPELVGPAAGLAAPGARGQGERAWTRWAESRRAPPLGRRAVAVAILVRAARLAATGSSSALSNPDTIAKHGRRQGGPDALERVGHRLRRAAAARGPGQGHGPQAIAHGSRAPTGCTARSRRPRLVAPGGTAIVEAFATRRRLGRRQGRHARRRARRGPRAGAGRPRRRHPGRRTRTSSTRSTATSR